MGINLVIAILISATGFIMMEFSLSEAQYSLKVRKSMRDAILWGIGFISGLFLFVSGGIIAYKFG